MLPAKLILAILGGFLALWAITLILRALGLRIEQALARRRLAAGKPIPAYARTTALLGSTATLTLGFAILPFGLVIAGLGLTIERWLGGIPAQDSFGDLKGMLAATLILLAPGCALAGWFFDPSRGRPRCPKCWYDLEPAIGVASRPTDGPVNGLANIGGPNAALPIASPAPDATPSAPSPDPTPAAPDFAPVLCTECGARITGPRDLHRTRRNRTLFWLAGLALLASYLTFKTPQVMRWGVRGLIPSTVLIAGFEWMPESLIWEDFRGRAPQNDSLYRRMRDRELWNWQDMQLRSKAQRILFHSRDVRTLFLAAAFGTNQRFVQADRLDVVIDALISGDPELVQRAAMLVVYGLDVEIREHPAAAAHVTELFDLTTDPDGNVSQAATLLVPLSGASIESKLGMLRSAIDRAAPGSLPARRNILLLSDIATYSDKALEIIRAMCTDPQYPHRPFVVARAARLSISRPELGDFFRNLIADPDDKVAVEACVASSYFASPAQCARFQAEQLLRRPAVRARLFDSLASLIDTQQAALTPELAPALKVVVGDTLMMTDERIRAADLLAKLGPDPESHELISALERTLNLNEDQLKHLHELMDQTAPPPSARPPDR